MVSKNNALKLFATCTSWHLSWPSVNAALVHTVAVCCTHLEQMSQYDSMLQIGFFALLIVELVAHRGLLDMLGFRIGAGLPFEI